MKRLASSAISPLAALALFVTACIGTLTGSDQQPGRSDKSEPPFSPPSTPVPRAGAVPGSSDDQTASDPGATGSTGATDDDEVPAIGGWLTRGPLGGETGGLVVDPNTAGTAWVFAGARLYRSRDYGASWAAADGGLSDLALRGGAVAVRGARVYLLAYVGRDDTLALFRSDDAGATFTRMSTAEAPLAYVMVALANGDLLACGIAGVSRSSDGGVSFAAPVPPARCTSLAEDPAHPGVVIAGSEGAPSLHRSSDHGESFAPVTSPLSQRTYVAASQDAIYAACQPTGLFRSQDAGLTFEPLASPPHDATAIAAGAADALYLGVADGLLTRSNDSFANVTSAGDAAVHAIASDVSSRALWVATAAGVRTSRDDGATFAAPGAGMRALPLTAFTLDPTMPGLAWTVSVRARVLQTMDAGRAWQELGDPIDGASALTVLAGGTTLVVSHGLVTRRSTDGGQTWSNVAEGSAVSHFAQDPDRPRVIFAAGTSGVAKSTDGGATWGPTACSGDVSALAAGKGGVPWIIVEGVAQASLDGGGHFHNVTGDLPNGLDLYSLASSPVTENTAWLGTSGGLFRTSDAGEHWSLAKTPDPSGGIWKIAVQPGQGTRVWAADDDHLFYSEDGGASFVALPSYPGCVHLAVDAAGALYCAGAGLQVSASGGR